MQAIDTKGGSRAEWETLAQLLVQIGAWPRGKEVPDNMESLFNLLAQEIPAFADLTWAGLGDGGATLKI